MRTIYPLLSVGFFLLLAACQGANTADEHLTQAYNLIFKNRFDDAEQEYLKVIKNNPHNFKGYYGIASLYSIEGKFDDALINFDQCIKINPRSAVAYYGRAAVKELMVSGGQQDLKKAVAVDSNFYAAILSLAKYEYSLGDYNCATKYYNKAIMIQPANYYPYLILGTAYYKEKYFDSAVVAYSKAIAIKQNDATAYIDRGMALAELKNYDAAFIDLHNAITINATAQAYVSLGYCEFLSGKSDLACRDFHRANELDTSKAGPYIRKYCRN